MVFNEVQRPIEKTHQVIWDAFQVYGRIKWKRTLLDLENVPDVAYQAAINKINSIWGVKGLIMTRSNLVITWKVRPHMGIIS